MVIIHLTGQGNNITIADNDSITKFYNHNTFYQAIEVGRETATFYLSSDSVDNEKRMEVITYSEVIAFIIDKGISEVDELINNLQNKVPVYIK